MTKKSLIYCLLILIIAIFVYSSKFYYPPLPIENVSKREVLNILNSSSSPIVSLTAEKGYEWFIINNQNQMAVDEIIKDMVSQSGWKFTNKDGSGLFFEKLGERLIVTTEKWTGNYSIAQIPDDFN